MHDYLSLILAISPIEEKDLILFDVSVEEKANIIRQFNRALINAKGDGTDVAQIFLKPLITKYPQWGDTALLFGLCLAREGQFARAIQSLEFAINNTLGHEQYLTIAQDALRKCKEDTKIPASELPPVNFADKMKNAKMAEGGSPADRQNYQAPILMKASKSINSFQMASEKERRDIMMRSASGGDEQASDNIDIESMMTPGDKARLGFRIGIGVLIAAAVICLIIFVIIPVSRKINNASDNEAKVEFIIDLLEQNKEDPEVNSILQEYNAKYGTATPSQPQEAE
ncbi:hypothetical protein SAMN02910456_00714 [Ruminococcaceae bacterium YRB3002]|nr:hypothetical protein SAMN02910456_00714 [Ruminococcaceae bacterium YRB3002]